MNSLTSTLGIGFRGRAAGTPANTRLKAAIGKTFRCSPSGSGWQVYDATITPLTIALSTTTTLNLLTGLTNPLNEAISGAPFAHVYGVVVNHDVASLATGGIEVFGGASLNLFQGPLDSTGKFTLTPGMSFGFHVNATKTGWVADATHKNIDLKNLDGSNAATVSVFIVGKTT